MDMLDDMLRILTIYQVDDFCANPNVPEEIEHYARAALAIPDDEYIMGAMRLSYTKFCRGLVLGRDGIYWLNSSVVPTDVNQLSWRELSERKKTVRSLYKKISFGGQSELETTGAANGNKFIINLIDLLIASYEKQEKGHDGFVFDASKVYMLTVATPANKEELKAENEKSAENISAFGFIASLLRKMVGKG